MKLNTDSLQELKERVAQICVDMHKSVVETGVRYWAEVRRHLYATPSSYMELIRLYARMLRDNKRDFVSNRQRLQIGLSTLSDAYNMVGDMQEELLGLGPVIVQKAKVSVCFCECATFNGQHFHSQFGNIY